MKASSPAGRVRVVSGSCGGLWLKVPRNFPSRPTQDRVKQALFSTIAMRVGGASILDLYAGTGALGIEALSRGAAAVTFVDSLPLAITAIKENLEHCHLQATVIKQDAEAYAASCLQTFDLIFLDPPYEKGRSDFSSHPLLSHLARLLSPSGLVIWEHDADTKLEPKAHLELTRTSRYGSTALSYLQQLAPSSPDNA